MGCPSFAVVGYRTFKMFMHLRCHCALNNGCRARAGLCHMFINLSSVLERHALAELLSSRHRCGPHPHAVIPRRPFMLRISLLAKCWTDPPILSAFSIHDMYAW